MEFGYAIIGGELCHHGVKGMKWGVRRYRNKGTQVSVENKTKKGDLYRNRKVKNAVKISASIAATFALSYAGVKFSTNPKVRAKAYDIINKLSNTPVSEIPESAYTVYNKSLGRNLTMEELISKGLV